jgi:hypothetical protein
VRYCTQKLPVSGDTIGKLLEVEVNLGSEGIQRLFANIGQHIFCPCFKRFVLDFELTTLLLGAQEVSLHGLTLF